MRFIFDQSDKYLFCPLWGKKDIFSSLRGSSLVTSALGAPALFLIQLRAPGKKRGWGFISPGLSVGRGLSKIKEAGPRRGPALVPGKGPGFLKPENLLQASFFLKSAEEAGSLGV
jgi:hypothetical protein